jgi:hypothetical protein
MRARAFVFCAVLVAGCAEPNPDHDAKTPGTLLGTYALSGPITRDSCGADLLGAPDPWTFQVKLSRFENDLYWLNGREAIVGDIAANGSSFHFSTRVDVTISPAGRGNSGCVVSRYDTADGVLALEGEDVTAVATKLTFEYTPKNNSECLEIIGSPGGVQALPCSLSYSLSGGLVGAD